jgi:hypothetical protein
MANEYIRIRIKNKLLYIAVKYKPFIYGIISRWSEYKLLDNHERLTDLYLSISSPNFSHDMLYDFLYRWHYAIGKRTRISIK